jgi:hypothetical protein
MSSRSKFCPRSSNSAFTQEQKDAKTDRFSLYSGSCLNTPKDEPKGLFSEPSCTDYSLLQCKTEHDEIFPKVKEYKLLSEKAKEPVKIISPEKNPKNSRKNLKMFLNPSENLKKANSEFFSQASLPTFNLNPNLMRKRAHSSNKQNQMKKASSQILEGEETSKPSTVPPTHLPLTALKKHKSEMLSNIQHPKLCERPSLQYTPFTNPNTLHAQLLRVRRGLPPIYTKTKGIALLSKNQTPSIEHNPSGKLAEEIKSPSNKQKGLVLLDKSSSKQQINKGIASVKLYFEKESQRDSCSLDNNNHSDRRRSSAFKNNVPAVILHKIKENEYLRSIDDNQILIRKETEVKQVTFILSFFNSVF